LKNSIGCIFGKGHRFTHHLASPFLAANGVNTKNWKIKTKIKKNQINLLFLAKFKGNKKNTINVANIAIIRFLI
jgi:hypothetical protein